MDLETLYSILGKLANKLTSFVNKYTKKETLFLTKSVFVSSKTIDLFTDTAAIFN